MADDSCSDIMAWDPSDPDPMPISAKNTFTAEEIAAGGSNYQHSLLPPPLYYVAPKLFAGRKLAEDAKLEPPEDGSARFLKAPPAGYRRRSTPERQAEYMEFRRRQIPHLLKVNHNKRVMAFKKRQLAQQLQQPTPPAPVQPSSFTTAPPKTRSDSGYMSSSPVKETVSSFPSVVPKPEYVVLPPVAPEDRHPLIWSAKWFVSKPETQPKPAQTSTVPMPPTSSTPKPTYIQKPVSNVRRFIAPMPSSSYRSTIVPPQNCPYQPSIFQVHDTAKPQHPFRSAPRNFAPPDQKCFPTVNDSLFPC
uniref:Nuclear transcription factor Y subunit n=1 Tax=Panagrellus redivivus TaxID=6233 RepID=A0A7E4ZSH1_PANRE